MLLRAVAAATANLERHVDEVDALNVFPVPDGDTGSNMLATMRAALAEAERLPQGDRDLDSVAEALSRGALTGARGNSGVILSQIIRGMTGRVEGRRRADGVDLAHGLRMGSDVAYGSVQAPVEGTILTVIRDAADAAASAAGRQRHVEVVLADTIEAVATSVQRTTSLLPVLADAGVVDSGAQGLFRVLEGMLQVGRHDSALRTAPRPARAMVRIDPAGGDRHLEHRPPHGHDADGLGYETQYLLASANADIDVDALRRALLAGGDSVVVAGDSRRVRVHVHGPRPDLAIGLALPYGRLSHIEVRDLDDQVAQVAEPPTVSAKRASRAAGSPTSRPTAPAIAIVAGASAPGLADVLSSLGASVVGTADGRQPSVGKIAAAVAACGTPDVIVLPNDQDGVLAARSVASLVPSVGLHVVATRNAAEGIAAVLAFDASLTADENAGRMADEAAALRSFSVITAASDSVVDGHAVRVGDILALDAGDRLLAWGADIGSVTMTALLRFDGFELVTLYLGSDIGAETEGSLRARFVEARLPAELEFVDGGQRARSPPGRGRVAGGQGIGCRGAGPGWPGHAHRRLRPTGCVGPAAPRSTHGHHHRA